MSQNDQFLSAIRQIAAERGIEMDRVLEAIKHAIRVGFKHDYPEDNAEALEIDVDMDKGTIAVYADKKVIEEVTHPPTQISVEDAHKIEERLKVGDHILVEITQTGDFGRVAAQAARQVIMQLVREAEKESILKQFADRMGSVESGIVQRMDRDGNVLVEIGRAIAMMPQAEQIGAEFYRSADRIKVYLKEIHEDAKGKTLIVSRSDPDFLRALFAMEVPEIASGTVEIMAIAREAGSRSKVAVRSNTPGVDPIGSCVGQRGARINAITNELKSPRGEEKIDIIPWDQDTEKFIANAIRPAEAAGVKIADADNKHALVFVNEDDLSLAIGREGQNVRLAAKLTGWKLDIQGNKNSRSSESKAAEAEQAPEETAASETETEMPVAEVESAPSADGLAALELSTRVMSALDKAGITSVEQLKAAITAGDKIAGVGPKAVEEISAKLN